MTNTPHIAPNGAEIAETILLPGDPLRAKFIADTYLENVVQFNTVRNMFGYTGDFKGQRISVMGTGMGIPSASLYTHELIHTFGVKRLIRIGTCGGLSEGVDLFDIVVRVFRADCSCGQAHVGEREMFGRQRAIVAVVIAGRARADVSNLGTLEAIPALGCLEPEGVPVFVSGVSARDAGVDLLVEIGDGLFRGRHAVSFRWV